MRRPSVLALTTAALLLGTGTATAAAACDETTDPLDRVREAAVVVTAVALPGPTAPDGGTLVGPAAFRVERYDKGGAGDRIRVTTNVVALAGGGFAAVPQQIGPLPGERWRLNLVRAPGGVFASTVCLGSAVVGVPAPAPRARVGGRTVRPRRSNWLGLPAPGRPVTISRRAAVRLRATRVLAIGLVRGRRIVRTGRERGGVWAAPSGVRRGDRLVLDTGDAFYGLTVR